ncbi:hypothetical protein FQN57_005731 [Myotisia sp. PD_48]|nr:hypothetical protein FQN57_005731 [Myotisia sp. PD_48]
MAAAIKMFLSQIPDNLKTTEAEQEAEAIVKGMGCLPLGVQAVVGLINEAGCSLRSYNEQWNNPRLVSKDSTALHVYRNSAPYEKALADVLFETLHSLDDDTWRMAEIFSLLDPDNIQEDLFLADKVEGNLRDVGYITNCVKCIGKLSKGLIGENNTQPGQYYRSFHMHPLFQTCIQMKMIDEYRRAAVKAAAELLCTRIDDAWELDWPKIREQSAKYFSHVRKVHKFYVELADSNTVSNFDIPLSFIAMLRKGAWLCYKRNFFRLGVVILKTAENVLNQRREGFVLVGSQDSIISETIQICHTRACIESDIGNFTDSLKYFQLGLDYFNEGKKVGLHGFRRQTEKILYGGVVNSLNGLGQDEEAESHYLKCIKLKHPDDPDPTYEINLNRCLWSQGPKRYQEASDSLLEIIAERERRFGVEDTKDDIPGHAFYVLGNLRIDQGRPDEAYELHTKAFQNWEKTLGTEHHKTADAYHKLGWHLSRKGDHLSAMDYLQSALDIYEGVQTKCSGEIARTTYKMSLVLQELGDNKEAKACLQTAESIRQEILGDKYYTATGEESYNELVSIRAR